MLQSSTVEKNGNCDIREVSEGGGGRVETRNLVVTDEDWDCSLHLPVWISHVEKGNIEKRLEGWVQSLRSLSIDFESLSKKLKKPLRPLWISQNSVIWLNELPELDDWPFTPIILVSASRPSVFTQRYTDADFSWSYIPGAADDEESWARGLTPALFWKHHREILEGGPTPCNAKVADTVERDRVYRALRGNLSPQVRLKAGAKSTMDSQSADAQPSQHQKTSNFKLLMEQNAVVPEAGLARISFVVGIGPSNLKGFHWIGDTGLAVGNEYCGSRDDIYEVVDNVINCGTTSKPTSSFRKETYLYLPIVGPKLDRYSLQNHLGEAIAFAKQKLSSQQTVLIYCSNGEDISVCVCLAVLLFCRTADQGVYSVSSIKESQVTKSDLRQQLIYLSGFNSSARPCRASLRQVFNFFNANFENGD